MSTNKVTRREFARTSIATASLSAAAAVSLDENLASADESPFELKYLLGSCLYGYKPLAEILPEAKKVGASAIDIWPKVHGNQREQLDELGEERFAALLSKHHVTLGCITQYKLGPLGLADELKLAKRLGCKTIVTGAVGPKGLKGSELKAAVGEFVEKMKPHLEIAEQNGVEIAIENHANSLIESPDSMKYLAELRPSKHLAVAFAPYHLPQDERLLSDLLLKLGEATAVFYAWQHGMGCMKKLPKQQELLQMPGRGPLDFAPLLNALRSIRYSGWMEVFMHPVPRGIPIHEKTEDVTSEISLARGYLEKCLRG